MRLIQRISGSGKSTISQLILEQFGAIRVRSDVERKRLFGLSADADSKSSVGSDLYSASASEATYQLLGTIAHVITAGGYPVIIDATFLKRSQRDRFKAVADEIGVPFVILHFHADDALLRKWIIERGEKGGDASEADISVLEHQIKTEEPLGEDELMKAVSIDAGVEVNVAGVCKTIQRHSN